MTHNFEPKFHQQKIIHFLFETGGATALQILLALKPGLVTDFKSSRLAPLYQQLKYMESEGIVKIHRLKKGVRTAGRNFYYLTKKGLDVAKELIQWNIWAFGYGYQGKREQIEIPCDLYSPSPRQLAHHVALVNLGIELNYLKSQVEYMGFRYYYLTVVYNTVDGKRRKIKRYAEIELMSSHYVIEIDTGRSNAQNLRKKFMGYREWLDHEGRTGHVGMVFVTDHLSDHRYKTIMQIFLETMGDRAVSVNLIICTRGELIEVLMREYVRQFKAEEDWTTWEMYHGIEFSELIGLTKGKEQLFGGQ